MTHERKNTTFLRTSVSVKLRLPDACIYANVHFYRPSPRSDWIEDSIENIEIEGGRGHTRTELSYDDILALRIRRYAKSYPIASLLSAEAEHQLPK